MALSSILAAKHGLPCSSSHLPISASASNPSALLRLHSIPALQAHLPVRQHVSAAADEPAAYTSIKSDPLHFWDIHPSLQCDTASDCGDLLPKEDDSALFLDAELRLLANAASDRAEMHSILAQQRDNWNELFQRMLTATSMTACVLSGLNGQAHSLSLCLPALLLDAGTAAMMAIINQFQPSQLAEEQRTATRLFRKLASDIQFALQVAPPLHQHAPVFLHNCKRRLQALDKAFPMPLTPGGLEKFPAEVVPPVLIQPESAALHSQNLSPSKTNCNNGWDEALTKELQRVATLLGHSDVLKYTGWAQYLVKVNKCLAIAAPLFATSAAVLNAVVLCAPTLSNILGMWSALCTVQAAFVNSFSNDLQLGMVFELYRNSAGYHMDVKMAIEETLHMPIKHRENGALFRQRIMYQLGRWPTDCTTSLVSPCTTQTSPSNASSSSTLLPIDAKEASTLF